MRSLGDILGSTAVSTGQSQGRRGEPVRRHSRLAGREGVFWRPTNRQATRRIILAAEKYEIETKEPGCRNGALGHIALEILRYMANLVSHKTGQLDPSLETLMRKLGRSKDAIVRALKALRMHGFIDWLRRYVPTGNNDGVQVQQTSNAYRLMLPERAKRLLGRYGKNAPVPDDFAHAQATREAELNVMRDALTMPELALFEAGDTALGRSLARLGSLLAERESAKRSESQSQNLYNSGIGHTPDPLMESDRS